MQKWSNSVRRTDRPAKPAIFRRPFFSRFGPFGVDLEKKISAKIFAQKNLEKFRDLSQEHLSPLPGKNETIMSSR